MFIFILLALGAITLLADTIECAYKKQISRLRFIVLTLISILLLFIAVSNIFVIELDEGIDTGIIQDTKTNILRGTTVYLNNNGKIKTYCVDNDEILEYIWDNPGAEMVIGWKRRVSLLSLLQCKTPPIVFIERKENYDEIINGE